MIFSEVNRCYIHYILVAHITTGILSVCYVCDKHAAASQCLRHMGTALTQNVAEAWHR